MRSNGICNYLIRFYLYSRMCANIVSINILTLLFITTCLYVLYSRQQV